MSVPWSLAEVAMGAPTFQTTANRNAWHQANRNRRAAANSARLAAYTPASAYQYTAQPAGQAATGWPAAPVYGSRRKTRRNNKKTRKNRKGSRRH